MNSEAARSEGTTPEAFYTVSQVNQLFSKCLENAFPELRFLGEISEVKRAQSGHVYLTIKDAKSQLAAVMWAGMARSVTFPIVPGTAVQCFGRPNIYPVTGRLQVAIHRMELAGEGLLRKRFLELKAKLEREGLFAPERKRTIPFLPRAVGVVTSAEGAVIHDIMVRIRERMPCLPVYLIGVRVQGPGSADEIAAAVVEFNRLVAEQGLPIDVLIVGRGGGSLEDLWSFNEEVVVRAIFASRIAIISAVGHETDISLADFVADRRAPTPTAAAEMVSPRRDELLAAIAEYARRLRDYSRWLSPLEQRVDEAELRLQRGTAARFDAAKLQLSQREGRLRRLEPHALLTGLRGKLALLEGRLSSAVRSEAVRRQRQLEVVQPRLSAGMDRLIGRSRVRLAELSARLQAVNPAKVLERGFSLVERADGTIVRRASELAIGDELRVRFAQSEVSAAVTKIERDRL